MALESNARSHSRLLSLPAELRLQIYSSLTPALTLTYPIPHNKFITSLTHAPPPLSTLLVCHSLTAELQSHFFARATFALRTSSYAIPAFLSLCDARPVLLTRIRNLEIAVLNGLWPEMAWMWTAPLDLLELLERHMTGLRVLKVSWDDADGRSRAWRKPRVDNAMARGRVPLEGNVETWATCDEEVREMLLEPLRRWEGRVRFVLGNVVARERGEEEAIQQEVRALDGMFVGHS